MSNGVAPGHGGDTNGNGPASPTVPSSMGAGMGKEERREKVAKLETKVRAGMCINLFQIQIYSKMYINIKTKFREG